MPEPDFAGIEPTRVPEAKRRLAAIDKYLSLPSPTGEDAIRLARSIGITRYQFQRLVKAWCEHRNAKMLVVTKRGRATRNYGIDPRAKAIATEVIEASGADAQLTKVAPIVEQRCVEVGAKPPSRPTIYNWIRQRQAQAANAEGAPRIVVGRMWPRLVVKAHPDTFPLVLVAVALPEKCILAHRVSFDPARPASVRDLVDDLLRKRSTKAMARPLLLSPNDLKEARRSLRVNGLDDLKSHPRSLQRIMSQTFGGALADIRVVFQIQKALKTSAANLSRQDEAISEDFAMATIDQAVSDHNRRCGYNQVSFDIAVG